MSLRTIALALSVMTLLAACGEDGVGTAAVTISGP